MNQPKSPIERLLASMGLPMQRDGAKFPISLVDKHLEGRSIGDRMLAKEALYHAGLIDG